MSDFISRRDAIEKMRFENGFVDDGLVYVPLRDVRNHLRSLPPAQPERAKGEWIPKDERYHCNLCDCIAPKGIKWDFCPNCGAKMEG